MAVTSVIRGATHVRSGNATVTASFASLGPQDGDWVFVMVCNGSNAAFSTVEGWSELHAQTVIGTRRAGCFVKQWHTGDPTSVNVTGSVAVARTVSVVVVGNLEASGWVVGAIGMRADSGSSFNNVAPAVSAPSNSLVLCFSYEATTATETILPTISLGTAVHWSNSATSGTESNLITETTTEAAATVGPITITYPNTQSVNGCALQVAFPTTQVEVPPDPTFATAAVNTVGGVVVGQLWTVTEDGPERVKEVIHLAPGYASVDAMIAADPFYIAHRGGSRDYPEMSLHAYTQSVAHGFGALEISLSRTSTGQWFGLHDQTLDRTSGITGDVNPNTLTWTQVQTYSILGSVAVNNPSQPNRPYMRLEEILERYYSTHVLFIDPKHAAGTANRTELFGILDALPGVPQDRIVIKYYGVEGNLAGTTGLAVDARAHGYKTWGYFYDADLPNLDAYHGRWDMLGYTYNGTNWSTMLAKGKPVIGHICPDQAAVDMAIAAGAAGCMVSGVANIVQI